MDKVYILKGKSPVELGYKSMGILEQYLKENVLIKPNITVKAEPGSGIITDFRYVEGIIDFLLDRGIEPKVGEGMGNASPEEVRKIFKFTGYEELCRKKGVELINLNETKSVKIRSGILKGIKISKLAFDYQIINVPVMKTHRLADTSLSIKNLIGFIQPFDKKYIIHEKLSFFEKKGYITKEGFEEVRQEFSEKLTELNKIIPESLNIIDGFYAREGDGFYEGNTIKMGVSVVGNDRVSCDFVASYLMGIEPYYLSGMTNISKIRVRGSDTEKLKRKFRIIRNFTFLNK